MEERKSRILDFVNQKEYTKITVKQLAVILGVPKEDIKFLEKIIYELEKEGKVYIDDSKRICKLDGSNFYTGKYETKSRGFGFVRVNESSTGEFDIYIEKGNSLTAMDGDTVLVKILEQPKYNKKAEGVIVKIISKQAKDIVGVFVKNENFGFVIPSNKGIDDIYIPKKYMLNVKDNQVVTARILKTATSTRKAEGKIVKILGDMSTKNIERDMIMVDDDIPVEFPKNVLDETEKIINFNILDELKSRVDLRSETIFTIDDEQAKDLDDAVSIDLQDDGTYKLSVHIADVSFFVRDGSLLDKEAIKRGTSVYFPGSVIPMLPKAISDGVCSLTAGEDKLALTIDMIVDEKGNVIFSNIYKSVINSKCKMNYADVQRVIEGDKKVYKEYRNKLILMNNLACLLRAKRKKSGSIDFDIPESKITLNEDGKVENIEPYITKESNALIEEFMLLANQCVAKTFCELAAPFIYRIHEKPLRESLEEVNEVLVPMGYAIKGINKIHPRALADIIERSKLDEKNNQIISKLVLRSLKLAKYSDECLGHFGLNFNYYTHFTSPIRRYPDLFIHRVISDYIENGYVLDDSKIMKYTKQAKKYADSSSECERRATKVERRMESMYMAMYMKSHLGDTFMGNISSITKYGMYVKLQNTIEGLVSLVNLDDDYYIYDEEKMRLIGKNTRKTYMIGDRVEVQVVKAEPLMGQIDYIIVGD